MKRVLQALVLGICMLSVGAVQAQEGWRQVGVFRSDSRNVSVGKGEVRVVSVPPLMELYDDQGYEIDTNKVNARYPGWDHSSDVVITYTMTPEGFRQSGYTYGLGAERKALPGDTISTSLGIYDQQGKRRAKVPDDLRSKIGPNSSIVAAVAGNLDADADREWAVAVAGKWDAGARGAVVNVTIYDFRSGGWELERSFELKELVRSGPIEIRDVTGDGRADVVYRAFHERPGHYYVDAHVFSNHAGLKVINDPLAFAP